jgi:hypothetical protein
MKVLLSAPSGSGVFVQFLAAVAAAYVACLLLLRHTVLYCAMY